MHHLNVHASKHALILGIIMMFINARNYVTKLIKGHKITYYKDKLGNADNKSMISLIKSLVSIETRALPDCNSLYVGCVAFSDFFSERVKMLVINL